MRPSPILTTTMLFKIILVQTISSMYLQAMLTFVDYRAQITACTITNVLSCSYLSHVFVKLQGYEQFVYRKKGQRHEAKRWVALARAAALQQSITCKEISRNLKWVSGHCWCYKDTAVVKLFQRQSTDTTAIGSRHVERDISKVLICYCICAVLTDITAAVILSACTVKL